MDELRKHSKQYLDPVPDNARSGILHWFNMFFSSNNSAQRILHSGKTRTMQELFDEITKPTSCS